MIVKELWRKKAVLKRNSSNCNQTNFLNSTEYCGVSQIAFIPDDSKRDLLSFKPDALYEKYNSSDNPVDILSSDNLFVETEIAHGKILTEERTGIIHIFKMEVDPGHKHIENFRGQIQWYMMEIKYFISNISFEFEKIENENLVSINGRSISFRLSIRKT